MKSRSFRFQDRMAFSAVFLFGAAATVLRAGETCKDSAGNSPCEGTNTPCVCVERADLTPDEGTDFTFDFSDPSNVDVTFKTGHSTNPWRVWSQVSFSDTTPDNLGDLFIDSTGSTDNYKVEIKNPNNGYPGAGNLGSADLDDETNWSGYSSITDGGITGNLAAGGITVVEASGSGGELDLRIDGNATGRITAPIVKSLFIIGNLSGDITVSNKVDGTLRVGGTVDDVVIEIKNTAADANLLFNDGGGSGSTTSTPT